MKSVFVIIPAHNEEKTIAEVIKKTKKYCKNIVVVDDGSKDRTYETANKEDIFVLNHIVNLGKGASIITGSEFALSKGADILIYMDADLQHNPVDIPRFIEALKETDVVFGVRKLNKRMPLILKLGNQVINKITKILYSINLKDTQCGYRALTKESYKKIKWKASDYSMESEMIANIGKKHLRYKEIAIETSYPNKYKGTTIFHGIKIIADMITWKFRKT